MTFSKFRKLKYLFLKIITWTINSDVHENVRMRKRGRIKLYGKIVHYGLKLVLNHMVEMFLVF